MLKTSGADFSGLFDPKFAGEGEGFVLKVCWSADQFRRTLNGPPPASVTRYNFASWKKNVIFVFCEYWWLCYFRFSGGGVIEIGCVVDVVVLVVVVIVVVFAGAVCVAVVVIACSVHFYPPSAQRPLAADDDSPLGLLLLQ